MDRRLAVAIMTWVLLGCDDRAPVGGDKAKTASTVESVPEVVTKAGAAEPKGRAGEGDDLTAEAAPLAEPSTPKAVVDADADPTDPSSADPERPKAAEGPPPALPEGPAVAASWAADVETRVVAGSAALRVAADADAEPGHSIVWAQAVTASGDPAGPAAKLRKTTGSVGAIAAAYDGATLWVAWSSDQGKGSRAIEGLAGYDLSLKQTVKAKTLRFFRYGKGDFVAEDSMRMVARPGVGAGAALAAQIGVERCEGMFYEEEGMVDCNRLAVDIIGSDGTIEHTYETSAEGGDARLEDFIGTDEGVVSSLISWRGGALTAVTFVSYTGEIHSLDTCSIPPYDLAWVDDGLLSICTHPDGAGDPVELSCGPGEPLACGSLLYSRLDRKPRSTSIPEGKEVIFDRLVLGCKAGAPMVRVVVGKRHLDVPADQLDFPVDSVMTAGKCTGAALK